MLGGDGHGMQWTEEQVEQVILGENGHGQQWAPESQQMLGENGHGQWNPEMWQEEEAGDKPFFEAKSGPSGNDMSGPSGMGGGPSGDFSNEEDAYPQ